MTDLAFASALEQARMIRNGEVSSRELVDLYLDRIDTYDGDLNSYIVVLHEEAVRLADEKDELTASTSPGELPPFHGVPVSIKGLNLLEGQPATMGTRAMEDFRAPFDDEVVARLKRAGMVPLGTTNVPEFGTLPYTESELHGPARNPWDPGRTPGGSSGGAAAALAAGLCPVSQGSDGGGSLRIPASNCGLFTIKPSRHRVSRAPLFGNFGFELSTGGTISRTVADTAALLDVLHGFVPGDPSMLPDPERPFVEEVSREPGTLRIGVVSTAAVGEYEPAVSSALRAARDLVLELGHDVEEMEVPVEDDVVDAFLDIWATMLSAQPVPVDAIEPVNRWLVERARDISGGAYLMAEFRLDQHCRQLARRFHGTYDAVLLPVLNRLPLRIGEMDGLDPGQVWARMTAYVGSTPMVNATGEPAIAVPLYHDEDSGLPIGVQFVGRFAQESLLLRLAGQLEEAQPWRDRRPSGF